uniref:NADH-ubiquinone oxidoreductase chain 4L n=1 Tax=Lachesilla sp. LaspMLY TaxID=2597020 RepID=A0A8K1ZG10_9NEOP|nr:NADH dehydrogenase subunit 4L [Lachesilla sp. LaspMLY]
MFNYLFMLFVSLFMLGVFNFLMKSNFLLMMLLSLEYLSFIIFILMYLLLWNSMEKYLLMFYLSFCVCEGSFGLSILVSLVRNKGSDYLQSVSFLKC